MQNLNHHHLYLFWTLGKTGSFTRAAGKLGIAQSAVTSQVRQLEESLSLPLLDRTNPRRPVLTAEGRRVMEYAEVIFESSRELMSWARKGESAKQRSIRIGAISGLSRNLQFEFMKPFLRRSDIRYELLTGDQRTLLSRLWAHELDVVLSSRLPGDEERPGLLVQVLTASPVVFVRRKGRRRGQGLSWREQLRSSPLYIPGRTFEARPELDAFLEGMGGGFTIRGEVEDIALLRILALRSGAVVAIPRLGVQVELEKGDLQVLAVAREIRQKFYAITRQRVNPSAEVRQLIESARQAQGRESKR